MTIRLHRLSTRPRLLVASVIAGLIVAFPGLAHAHNAYDSSEPSDGQVVSEAPAEWVVTFEKDVTLDSASAEAIDSSGVRLELGPAQAGSAPNVIRFALPVNLSGSITLRWKLIGTDGHVISGRIGFLVDSSAAAVAPPSTSGMSNPTDTTARFESVDPTTPEPIRWFLRLVVFVAALAVGGLVLAELFLAQGTLASARGRRLLRASAGALTIGSFVQLLILLSDFHGGSIIGSITELGGSFDSTPLGMAAIRLLVGLAIALVGFARIEIADETPVARRIGALLIIFLFGLAYTSHSRSQAWPLLGIPADIVHTAAVATWLGGLLVMMTVIAPQVSDRDLLYTFRRFGRAATFAVPVIVFTGVIQTLRLHGGFSTLFTEQHGRMLLLKLVTVATMLALAKKSRDLNLKRIAEEPQRLSAHRSRLMKAAFQEALAGGAVIGVTAALVNSNLN